MSRLLYSATMSLDGFIAGVDGDMSWLTEHLGASDLEIDDLMAGIGALLVGKRTFTGDDPNRGTDAEGAFGGKWHGPSIVLTHDPPAGATDPDITFVRDLDTAVRTQEGQTSGLSRSTHSGWERRACGCGSVAKPPTQAPREQGGNPRVQPRRTVVRAGAHASALDRWSLRCATISQ